MKRFFLIPLMTVLCTVMAWGENVATEEELIAAVADASAWPITLTADITLTNELTISDAPNNSYIDLGGFTLTGNIKGTTSSSKVFAFKNGTLNGTVTNNSKSNIRLGHNDNLGTLHGTITLVKASSGAFQIYSTVEADVTIQNTKDASTTLTLIIIGSYDGTLTLGSKVQANITTGIVGGNVVINANAKLNMANANGVCNASVTNNGTVTMSNGNLLGSLTNGTVTITGGTISNSLIEHVNTESYAIVDNGNGTSTISPISIRNTTQNKPYGPDLTIALNEANEGDEISFLQNVNVPAGKTLNMPNVTISHNSKLLIVDAGGTLNIGNGCNLSLAGVTVNGTLNISTGATLAISGSFTTAATGTVNYNGGSLTTTNVATVIGVFNMTDGTWTMNPSTATMNGLQTSGAIATTVAEFNMSGGSITYKGTGKAININQAAKHINITGGTITAENASALAIYFNAATRQTTNLKNLTINAAGQVLGANVSAGTIPNIDMENCTFTGSVADNDNSVGIMLLAGNEINIYGGTYRNTAGKKVFRWNNSSTFVSSGSVNLKGGEFLGKADAAGNYPIVSTSSVNVPVYLYAGTSYNIDPRLNVTANTVSCKEGAVTQVGDLWEVIATGVKVNEVEYSSIPSSWSTLNDTITLLSDYEWVIPENLYIPAANRVAINLNGYTLTVRAADANTALSSRGELYIYGTISGSKLVADHAILRAAHNGKVVVNGGTYEGTANTLGLFYCDTQYDGEGTASTIELNDVTISNDKRVAVQSLDKGILRINNSTISSNASNMWGFTDYAVIAGGTTTVTNSSITGVHGALSITGANANATINSGDFQTVECSHGGNSHYALYVAYGAQASVYGGKFKSYNASYPAVMSGNEDVKDVMGVVFLYGGQYSKKAKTQMAEGSTFPASVPATSTWYASFGDEAPLPAGYEYQEITSGADYEAGYRWQVVCSNNETKEIVVPTVDPEDPDPTIPWQQNTTWDPNADPTADGIVPEESTIVTIPVGATVVVSNAQEDIEAGGAEAVAEQVFVNQGATLTVETGTTLKIGEGGVNIANGGQIVVEPNAIVTVGDAGIVTTEDKAIIIEASEQEQGVLLLNPAVEENTRPKATVKLVTKSKQIAENDFIYERFAIPTYDGETTTFSIEGGTAGIVTYNDAAFGQGLYGWSYDADDWVGLARFKDMKPFNGYQLTNNSLNGGVTYVFEGNLVGNNDANYTFSKAGFGFFGNSYTGAIDIKKFLEGFGGDMQKSIWIYDYHTDGFKIVTEDNYGTVNYGSRRNPQGSITEIRSMQAFIMNRGASGDQSIDYSNAIWGNPRYGLPEVPEVPAGAPAKKVAEDKDNMTIYVFSGNKEDEVTLMRSNDYSNEFDNGADASKWMNKGMNLYIAGDENLAILASNNIDNTTIAFQSGKETEYTIGFADLRGEAYILRDVLTGAMIQMVEGAEYTFTQEANTTVPSRFQVIAPARIPTGVENVENAPVMQKVLLNGTLYILRDNKWYSVQGQNVK